MISRIALSTVLIVAQILTGPGGRADATQAAGDAVPRTQVLPFRPLTTVYLPNITRMLGGPDGWQTPFIVQNVGSFSTDLTVSFYSFADGSLVKTRSISALAAGSSVFHDPNSDSELPAGGQFSVVVRSTSSPIVALVNEHQNVQNQARQEALSYQGLSQGSTSVFAPYFAYDVDGWLTTLIVQGLGTRSTIVTLRFTSTDGSRTATLTRSVEPGRAAVVDPRGEPTLQPGTEYSISLSAGQPIGVVVNAHNDAPSVAAPRGFSYNGSPGTNELYTYVPWVAKNSEGRSTRLFVQNAGAVARNARLGFCKLGTTECPLSIDSPMTLAPGATWVLDMRATTQLPDGDYSVFSISGFGRPTMQVAMLAATTSPSTAMGTSGIIPYRTKWFLPNVTRTLGGSAGWTTPIVIQATSSRVTTARLSWYRFADGALVTQQTVTGLQGGTAVRVDPRSVPQLSDNTQYAVVVESPSGGVAVVVTELNYMGGDSAMAYEGFPLPEVGGFGTSSCTPAAAPAGTTFVCRGYGLPAGATPITSMTTNPSGSPSTSTYDEPVAADGSTTTYFTTTTQGNLTITWTAGGATTRASFTVLPATFALSSTGSRNGFVSAQTKAGIPCAMYATQPDGNIAPYFYNWNVLTDISDATGLVSFEYPSLTSPTGTWRNVVRCTSGSETLVVSPTFIVP